MLDRLRIKIFADGADLKSMKALAANPQVKGFTTNPTLMRKANITDYVAFAHEVLAAIPDRPVSFEVFADEFPEMEAQALEIASWGKNVYVKIPVTNTKSEPRRCRWCNGCPSRACSSMSPPSSPSRRSRRSRAHSMPPRRPSSPCSPAALPTPASIRCR